MAGPSAEESARIRGYLQAQAAKLGPAELAAKLRADVAPLHDLAASVPAARFLERPAQAEWSAAEICTHILDMNDHGDLAIRTILDTGTTSPGVATENRPGVREGLTGAAAFSAAFSPVRERLLARVADAVGDEHLGLEIVHPWFGALNWREWFLFMRVHDLDHLRQLEGVAEQFKG